MMARDVLTFAAPSRPGCKIVTGDVATQATTKHRVRGWYVALGIDEAEISSNELDGDKAMEAEASREQGPWRIPVEARGIERVDDGERSHEEVKKPKMSSGRSVAPCGEVRIRRDEYRSRKAKAKVSEHVRRRHSGHRGHRTTSNVRAHGHWAAERSAPSIARSTTPGHEVLHGR